MMVAGLGSLFVSFSSIISAPGNVCNCANQAVGQPDTCQCGSPLPWQTASLAYLGLALMGAALVTLILPPALLWKKTRGNGIGGEITG